MRTPRVRKPGRYLMVAAVSALLPLTAAQAEDIDSTTPTYSGEDRRPFHDQTPGAQGPVRSDTQMQQQEMQQQDPYDSRMRGAEGPTRSEQLEAQGYTGERMSDRGMAGCPQGSSERFAPNAYYGEANPFLSGSPDAKASFFGRGRWC